jgi:hypothetical protein
MKMIPPGRRAALARSLATVGVALSLGLSNAEGRAGTLADGLYIIHPAGVPSDCIGPQRGFSAHLAYLGISSGCLNNRPVVLVHTQGGRYTMRSLENTSDCATVARHVVIGAPAINWAACENARPGDPCDVGAQDQVFDLIDGPNYLIYGLTPVGAQSFGAFDVGDYGPGREVKYWLPDTARPAKQRFTFDRAGPLPTEFAACQPRLAPGRPVRIPPPRPDVGLPGPGKGP